MPESKCITAGIAFGPVDPSALNRGYNTVPVGPAFQYLIAENVFAKLHFLGTGKLALAKSPLYPLFAETTAGSCLRRSGC